MVQPLSVEAPGKLYQTFGFFYPHNGARSREADSPRSLNADIGHGLVDMAKTVKHSLNAVSRGNFNLV